MKEQDLIAYFFENYTAYKNRTLLGRYLTFKDIEPELEKSGVSFEVKEIGRSYLNIPIHEVTLGKGPVKIFGWSQMHGNETTTTKAVFDLFNFFEHQKDDPRVTSILDTCTIKIIPMLNPDGAVRYTRENVNGVDLNRDAQDLNEPESRILRSSFDSFNPHFCLNLHDQRTIFGAGENKKPATISFLAPARDEERNIDPVRTRAMQLIAAINARQQDYLQGQTGRYDDAFNLNCTGDTFQYLGVPTLLFEAGHYQQDYMREETRKFMALAILSAIQFISSGEYEQFTVDDYFRIPENRKNFYDVILRNAGIGDQIFDIALQFQEKIRAETIFFEPVVQKIEAGISSFGHQEIDCKGAGVSDLTGAAIAEHDVVHQILLKNKKLSIKTEHKPY